MLSVVRDVSERKRAAEALQQMQEQLAHANRVATMGQLTASIAHEIAQPIGAVYNRANAALNFLNRDIQPIWRRFGKQSVVLVTPLSGLGKSLGVSAIRSRNLLRGKMCST